MQRNVEWHPDAVTELLTADKMIARRIVRRFADHVTDPSLLDGEHEWIVGRWAILFRIKGASAAVYRIQPMDD